MLVTRNTFTHIAKGSGKSLPCRLTRDAQRCPDLGPADLARSEDVDNLLELVALALECILDWLKALEQSFRRQTLYGPDL